LYFAVIDAWYITERPVAPKFVSDLGYKPDAPPMPAPLLPPDEYPVIMVAPMRAMHGGGGTTRKQHRHNRRTTMKKRAPPLM